jgi:type II secretory pathway pseudopilin PulG
MGKNSNLSSDLSKRTNIMGLKLWAIIGIVVAIIIVVTLLILWIFLFWRRRRRSSRQQHSKLSKQQQQQEAAAAATVDNSSREMIKEVKIDRVGNTYIPPPDPILVTISESSGEKESMEKGVVHVGDDTTKKSNSSFNKNGSSIWQQRTSSFTAATTAAEMGTTTMAVAAGGHSSAQTLYNNKPSTTTTTKNPIMTTTTTTTGQALNTKMGFQQSETAMQENNKRGSLGHETCDKVVASFLSLSGGSGSARSLDSPISSAPEVSHLGWGHWYTLRELEAATLNFGECNVLGEGGYGIVYKGQLPDSTMIAVKNLLNNRGQAEKEFRVEVEAIGRVRHKNLVRLLGYCAEGAHRMLVYEYVDNGNLEQWLHGPISKTHPLSWEARMKIVLGTAKG